MAFSYPEFHGRADEDVEGFLETMEVACISNHIQEAAQRLRLLQLCLKGDARVWSREHEAELREVDPPLVVTWDNLRASLATRFAKTEDPDKVWQEVQELRQRENEAVGDYSKKFSLLWERLCIALQPAAPPPDMMKKDRFLAGLRETLRWRVELKKPRTYEDTLEVARNKEWKQKRLHQLGINDEQGKSQIDPMHGRVPVEVSQEGAVPVVTQVMPAVVTTADEGLKQEMRQMVDLMKNLSLNLLENAGGNRNRGRPSNQLNEYSEQPQNGTTPDG